MIISIVTLGFTKVLRALYVLVVFFEIGWGATLRFMSAKAVFGNALQSLDAN